MAKVFIAHSSLDSWLVEPIGQTLRNIGIEPYIAEIETPEAKPLPTKLQEHIQTSNVIILLLTANVMKNAKTRDVINWEVATAHAYGKPVYVFTEKGVEVPLMISYITDYLTFDPIERKDLKSVMSRIERIAHMLKDNEDTTKAIVTIIAVGLGILLLAYILSRTKKG